MKNIPPQNIEAEKSLLGGIMIDQNVILDCMDCVKPDDFYRTDHKIIYEAMCSLANRNQPIDLITVTDLLNTTGKMAQAGGESYIVSLIEDVPMASNAVEYARIVAEKAIQRRLIQTATEIAQMAYEPETDVQTMLEEAEKKVFSIVEKRNVKSYSKIGDILPEIFDELTEISQKGALPGIPTGFIDLDKMLSGLQNSDLILVAARPGMGKTALMLNIATHVAFKEHVPVAVFNLEMSSKQLAKRLLSTESGVNNDRIRSGQLETDDWVRLAQTIGDFSEVPLYIDDSTDVTITSIRAKCRKMKMEKGIGLIVIDYLQLMSSGGKSDSRVNEVSDISRALKIMAKELNVPVIVGSQLSREVEKRNDKRPMLSDLRESGAIEQDADIVTFIYRDSYYKKNTDEKFDNIAELIVAKHRNGALGNVKLLYDGEHAVFRNVSFATETH